MIYECFLMCYFMHIDPISSRIKVVLQSYFWSGLEEFLGVMWEAVGQGKLRRISKK